MSPDSAIMLRRMVAAIALLLAGVLVVSRKGWCYPLGLACLFVGVVTMP